MGTVYKAYDRRLEEFVAIKLVHLDGQEDHRHSLRFKREAEATARLDHPSITKVIDFGLIDDAQPYLVMEFVEGKTLSAMIAEEGQLRLAEALPVFTAVCDALAHAHENKVLHRDLKPSNIMINRDSGTTIVKILDFGIAKILESAGVPSLHITRTGELLGSPFYMSPEQARGGHIDQRSDLYSLGCTMYEALTGGPPHIGENPVSTLLKRESLEPLRLAEASLGRKFPEELETIVAKLLRHDPNERYQSAFDLKRDLLKVSEQSELSSGTTEAIVPKKESDSSTECPQEKSPRFAAAMAAVALLVVASGALSIALIWHDQGLYFRKVHESLPTPPQVLSLADAAINTSMAKTEALRLRNEGRYELAVQKYLEAISELSSAPGNNAAQIAAVRQELGWTYLMQKQYKKASEVYEQVLAYFDKSFDSSDLRIADVAEKLAESYRFEAARSGDQALLYKAVPLYERTSKIYESHLPQTGRVLARCLLEETTCFSNLSNYEAKKRVLLKILKVNTDELGDKDPETLLTLARLAGCCHSLKQYNEALGYDTKWLAAYNDSPDEPQVDRAKALVALGFDYYVLSGSTNTSMLKTAEKLLTRSLNICQRDPERLKKQLARTYECLGSVYSDLGQAEPVNLERAESCTLKAARTFDEVQNIDKSKVAGLLKRACDIQMKRGHISDAKSLASEVLKLRTKRFGANSPEVLDIYWNLAEISRRQGRLAESAGYYERILSLSRRFNGPDSPITADAVSRLAENEILDGNLLKARRLLVNSLAIYSRALGPKNPKTLWVQAAMRDVDGRLKNPRADAELAGPKAADH